MNTAAAAAIPYERQADPETNRTCGAACLSMVYRSFGQDIPQAEIWSAIAKENRFGSLASTTHLMARDALARGFSAVAIQARHPLVVLRLCRDVGIRPILNHRLQADAPTGHYTVLVDIDDKSVVLHDPFHGPSRRLSHAEILELWQPRFPNAEIAGNVVIGVVAGPAAAVSCALCRTPIPASVPCPRCHQPVGLQPGALLGCVSSTCIGRMWNYLCCASCDYTWTWNLETSPTEAIATGFPNGPSLPGPAGAPTPRAPAAPALDEDSGKLAQLFGALDKFCNHILSLPDVAGHPEIKQQIAFIAASKQTLKVAQAEGVAHLKAVQEELTKMTQAAKQREEAHQKRLEQLNKPSPSLDGNALGRAFLKNLGLIS